MDAASDQGFKLCLCSDQLTKKLMTVSCFQSNQIKTNKQPLQNAQTNQSSKILDADQKQLLRDTFGQQRQGMLTLAGTTSSGTDQLSLSLEQLLTAVIICFEPGSPEEK